MDTEASLPYSTPESGIEGAGKNAHLPLSSKKGLSCILFHQGLRVQLLISLHQGLTDFPVWEAISNLSQADSFLSTRPFYEDL